MNKILSILLIAFVLVVISVPVVLAVGLPNPLSPQGTIADLLNTIIYNVVVWIAPPIVGIMILVGAFQILTAAGNEDKFKMGKKTIYWAVIGYAILLVAAGIATIIKNILGVQ